MNVCGVTFGGYLAKKLSFKLGNLLYKSNFYLLSEGTVRWLNPHILNMPYYWMKIIAPPPPLKNILKNSRNLEKKLKDFG